MAFSRRSLEGFNEGMGHLSELALAVHAIKQRDEEKKKQDQMQKLGVLLQLADSFGGNQQMLDQVRGAAAPMGINFQPGIGAPAGAGIPVSAGGGIQPQAQPQQPMTQPAPYMANLPPVEPNHPISQLLQGMIPQPEQKAVPANGGSNVGKMMENYNRNQSFAVAGANPNYQTKLSPNEEMLFRNWLKENQHIPGIQQYDPNSPISDYDMRGFWKFGGGKDTAKNESDGQLHFTDRFKTPYHETFSNESLYASGDAPHWDEDRLVGKGGYTLYDESMAKAEKENTMYARIAKEVAKEDGIEVDDNGKPTKMTWGKPFNQFKAKVEKRATEERKAEKIRAKDEKKYLEQEKQKYMAGVETEKQIKMKQEAIGSRQEKTLETRKSEGQKNRESREKISADNRAFKKAEGAKNRESRLSNKTGKPVKVVFSGPNGAQVIKWIKPGEDIDVNPGWKVGNKTKSELGMEAFSGKTGGASTPIGKPSGSKPAESKPSGGVLRFDKDGNLIQG